MGCSDDHIRQCIWNDISAPQHISSNFIPSMFKLQALEDEHSSPGLIYIVITCE